MTVPAGVNSGRVMRLKGRGIKDRSGRQGDQLVRLMIAAPGKIDDELKDFMSKWRSGHAYDPRRFLKGAT